MLLKSKSAKLMKVRKLPGACAQEIVDQKDVLRIFTNFYGTAQKSVSGQQLPQILPSSNFRFFLAQKQNKNDKERSLY
jgi:hypothetical protein